MMDEEDVELIAGDYHYDYTMSEYQSYECPIPKLWILSKPMDVTFNTNGMVPQRFPFPAPIMDYIFRNLQAHHLLKLYQTCKFFFDKYRFNIIENFEICDKKSDEFIAGNSMTISYYNPAYPKLKDLWISESFTCQEYGHPDFDPDFEQFSRMSIKKLKINGEIALDEFKLLVQSPFLVDLAMSDDVYNEDDEKISFTQIFDLIPNVTSLYVWGVNIYPSTMNELLSIERQTKLKKLHFDCILDGRLNEEKFGFLDPKLVAQFIMKNCTYDCKYSFRFIGGGFNETLESELASWKLTASKSVMVDDNCMTAIKPVSKPIDAGCAIDYEPVAMENEKCTEHVSKSINDECTTAGPDNNIEIAIKLGSEDTTADDTSTTTATVTEDFSTMMMAACGDVSKLGDDPHSSALHPIPTENDENLDLAASFTFEN